jgi:IS5 family transposase
MKDSKDDFRPLASESVFNKLLLQQLDYFEEMLDKHIDLVRRRVILKQNIPHEEKVFSLFEPYTEWVNKGKSPYRVELGLPIAVASDQYGFVLHHRVMIKESDAQVTIPIAEAILKWGDIYSISFDKGFWSKINYEALKPKVPLLVMPKKGKLTQKEFERENGKEFVKLRHQHAGVESDINALEHHGLNRCPDKGIKNFKRYVSLGILSLNLHRLGNILIAQDRARIRAADKKSNQTNRSKAA